MQNRTGIDKWTHLYMRGWVDFARWCLKLPDDDKADDVHEWFRYDNNDGWIFVFKDLGYVLGHVIGWLYPVAIIGVIAVCL